MLFDLDGSPRGEIPLPGIGSIVTIDAEPDDDEVRFVFTSFTQPPTAYDLPPEGGSHAIQIA